MAHITREENLSSNDLELQKYIKLENQIKELTKQKKEIQDRLKKQGSHSTRNFMCTVKTIKTENAPNKKELIEIFGESVKEHFKDGERTTVTVVKKGE